MQREQLPDDENGEALWRAVQNGLELGREHRVRFTSVFATYANAFQFACFLLRQGYWVQANEAEGEDCQEVLLDMGLEVTHSEISGAEAWLEAHAAQFGGRAAGWEIRDPVERASKIDFVEFQRA